MNIEKLSDALRVSHRRWINSRGYNSWNRSVKKVSWNRSVKKVRTIEERAKLNELRRIGRGENESEYLYDEKCGEFYRPE
jgi:hypothetical protein